jgi:hypothetical protein
MAGVWNFAYVEFDALIQNAEEVCRHAFEKPGIPITLIDPTLYQSSPDCSHWTSVIFARDCPLRYLVLHWFRAHQIEVNFFPPDATSRFEYSEGFVIALCICMESSLWWTPIKARLVGQI